MRKAQEDFKSIKLRVLITNDDGIEAAGLITLANALEQAGMEVMVVAPEEERSASSHSVSLRKPIQIFNCGPDRWAVTGTPVDSVNLAINHLLRDRRPELVISGINHGANLACDIHYSGTVGAAREGTMLGIPSFAISLETFRPDPDFGPSARMAVELARLIDRIGLPPRTFLNVNLPDLAWDRLRGRKVTVQGQRNYDNSVRVSENGKGETVYSLGGPAKGGEPIPDSDVVAVGQGFVSITPLGLDLTRDCALEWLRERVG